MRLRWRTLGVLGALGLAPISAAAECLMPQPAPTIPDGNTASEADLRAAHDAVQGFVNKLQEYQVCLENEVKTAPPDTRPELKIAWRTQGNAAIDQAHDLADDYAQQLKVFKASHPAKFGQK